MGQIENLKSKDLQQPADQTTCLFVLLRDTDVQFKNLLKSLLYIKKTVFANLSDQKIKRHMITKIPSDTTRILEDLNHIAYVCNELAKSLHKFN